MAFYTEKQMDDFLQSEERNITMPDGSSLIVNGSRLMWKHFDFLVDYTSFNEANIVKTTFSSCAETNLLFEAQFHEVVGFLSSFNRHHPVSITLPELLPSIKRKILSSSA